MVKFTKNIKRNFLRVIILLPKKKLSTALICVFFRFEKAVHSYSFSCPHGFFFFGFFFKDNLFGVVALALKDYQNGFKDELDIEP